MPSIGLRRVRRVRARFRDGGRSTEWLSRLSAATFDGRLARVLVGIVLALHLVGASSHIQAAQVHAAQVHAQGADDAASLSVALGQPIPTCHHGEADHPDAPAGPDCCDHCLCCQFLSTGIALGFDVLDWQYPTRSSQRVAYPTRENAVVRSNRAGQTAARGPPELS